MTEITFLTLVASLLQLFEQQTDEPAECRHRLEQDHCYAYDLAERRLNIP